MGVKKKKPDRALATAERRQRGAGQDGAQERRGHERWEGEGLAGGPDSATQRVWKGKGSGKVSEAGNAQKNITLKGRSKEKAKSGARQPFAEFLASMGREYKSCVGFLPGRTEVRDECSQKSKKEK